MSALELADTKEFQLKAGLAKLEAKELGGATAEASKDVGAASKLLGKEIRDGFRDVAKHL